MRTINTRIVAKRQVDKETRQCKNQLWFEVSLCASIVGSYMTTMVLIADTTTLQLITTGLFVIGVLAQMRRAYTVFLYWQLIKDNPDHFVLLCESSYLTGAAMEGDADDEQRGW